MTSITQDLPNYLEATFSLPEGGVFISYVNDDGWFTVDQSSDRVLETVRWQ